MTQPLRERITAAALKLCAGRTTMTGDEFIDALHELMEACAFPPESLVKQTVAIVPPKPLGVTEMRGPIATIPLQNRDVLPPQIKPQTNNRDLALAKYRTKNPYDIPDEDETPKKEEPPKPSRNGPMTEEQKDVIRQLARRAKIGRARLPHGFAARLAAEYDISESYVYNIIFTDPSR